MQTKAERTPLAVGPQLVTRQYGGHAETSRGSAGIHAYVRLYPSTGSNRDNLRHTRLGACFTQAPKSTLDPFTG